MDIKRLLISTLLPSISFSAFTANDASFSWSSGADSINAFGYRLTAPTTPLIGGDQTITFDGNLAIRSASSDVFTLESGIKWDIRGWKMYCRLFKDGHKQKTAFYPIRPGTTVTSLLEVKKIPNTPNSMLSCTSSATGYPSIQVNEGPIPTVSLHPDEIALGNSNTKIDGNCRKLVKSNSISFSDINVQTGTHYTHLDWYLNSNPECGRTLKVISDSAQNGIVAIHQNPDALSLQHRNNDGINEIQNTDKREALVKNERLKEAF